MRLVVRTLEGCGRCSGAATDGATWTPLLQARFVREEKMNVYGTRLTWKETCRIMRVMPRVHQPRIGKAPWDITFDDSSSYFIDDEICSGMKRIAMGF